jgi:hypothetical protein
MAKAHAPVVAREAAQDLGIEQEATKHALSVAQGVLEGRVVKKPQLAAQPGKSGFHGPSSI